MEEIGGRVREKEEGRNGREEGVSLKKRKGEREGVG